VGPRQALDLDVALGFPGRGDGFLGIYLVRRSDWEVEDVIRSPPESIRIDVTPVLGDSGPGVTGVSVSCLWDAPGEPVEVDVAGAWDTLPTDVSIGMALRTGAGGTGSLTASVDGEPVCSTRHVFDETPGWRLVLRRFDQGASPAGWALFDDVDLVVHAEVPAGPCAGVLAPVLGGAGCDAPAGGVVVVESGRPVVADDGTGFHLLFQATVVVGVSGEPAPLWLGPVFEPLSDLALVAGRSRDGRSGWSVTPLDPGRFASRFGWRTRPGALVHEPEAERLSAWIDLADEAGDGLFHASVDSPAAWERAPDGDVALRSDEVLELDYRDAAWVPEAVVRRDGVYQGWFTASDSDGRRAIHHATSDDGLDWHSDAKAVLASQPDDGWTADGVRAPSVVWWEELGYYVMAFEMLRPGAPSTIGLAASRDGLDWERHTGNPVVRGGTVGLDEAGAGEPALLLQGDRLWIWYVGTTESPPACPSLPAEHVPGRGTTISWTELSL